MGLAPEIAGYSVLIVPAATDGPEMRGKLLTGKRITSSGFQPRRRVRRLPNHQGAISKLSLC